MSAPIRTAGLPMPCNLGETDLNKCLYWKKTAKEARRQVPPETERLLPWTGNTFGMANVEFVAARSSPNLIGVVGAPQCR